jgi:capsular polysaccharide biosynthesis protein
VSEQALDLRSAMAVLRRHKRTLSAAAVGGLVLGVTFVFLQPPRFASTSLVLLPAPTASRPDPGVDTQVAIMTSAGILQKAGQTVRPPLSARELESRIVVEATTTRLIAIEAAATKARDAQLLSQGVADAYLGYVRQAASAVSASALADLNSRKSQLQAQVSILQEEIDATTERRRSEAEDSAEDRKAAQLLAQLRAEQADTSLQLDKVKGEIAAAAPGSDEDQATSVQRATPAIGQSRVRPLLLWGPIGMLLGAALAAMILLTLARTDPRVRLRDEIADAVGSPVLAVVRSRPTRSVAGWSSLLETYDAGPVDAWAFRQALRSLVPAEARNQSRKGEARPGGRVDHPRSVTVISLSGDVRGLAVGPQLAAFAASLGIITRLLIATGNDSAAALRAACSADRQADPRPGLIVGEVRPAESVELNVVLAIVDRKEPHLGHTLRTSATLLAVASGAVTEEELARLALAIDDAGRTIDGIILADPDRADRTTGRLSLDERARQVPLPTRLTGLRPGGEGTTRQVKS